MQSLASYLLLAVATALPHPQGDANSLASRGEANGLLARAGEEWTSDEVGANTNIGVSNDRIDWGDVKPWEVIMGLLDECHDNGCLPDAGVSQDTTVIATPGGKAADGTIVVTATGTFSKVEDEANLSTLVEVAALVFEELSEGENRVSSGVPYCTMNGQCQENGKQESVQYSSIRGVTITVNKEDGTPMGNLFISVKVDTGAAKEECSNIAGAGGSIAGIIGGWTAPFTLASLFCTATAGDPGN